jgi:hypothetical protein
MTTLGVTVHQQPLSSQGQARVSKCVYLTPLSRSGLELAKRIFTDVEGDVIQIEEESVFAA